jgi:hypothetical protein
MKPICSSILGFFQKFPEITAAENKGMFSYKSRLRQYFFPYKPSYDYMTLGKSDFFCIDDTTSIQSFEDIAELKTSQIFETATFKIGLKPFFKCIFSSTIPQKLPEQSHHLKIKTTFPYKIASPQKITREIKSCRRFIPQTGSDAKTMLKNYLSYTCSAKISRMVKSFSKTDFLPGFESSNYVPDYSFSGNFTIESVHWIILLSGFLKLGMQQPDYFSKNILNIKGKQSAFDFTTDFAVQKTFIPLFESPKDKLEQLQSPDFFASSNISQSFERKQNNLTGDFRIESYVYQKDYYPVFIKTDSRKEFDFSADAFLSPLTKICDSTPINAKPYAFDPNKISCKQYKSAPACVAPELKPILKHHNLRPLKTEFKHVSFPDWVDIDFATNISDMNCMQ